MYDDEDKRGEIGDKEATKIKFWLIRLLSKMHNIIIYICGLTAWIAEFLELAGRLILLNNYMR